MVTVRDIYHTSASDISESLSGPTTRFGHTTAPVAIWATVADVLYESLNIETRERMRLCRWIDECVRGAERRGDDEMSLPLAADESRVLLPLLRTASATTR